MHIENQLELEYQNIQSRLAEICQILRQNVGHDFRGHKETTLVRRIQRRMRCKKITSIDQYIELLKSEPTESQGLFECLVVSVTEFFREPQTFELLAQEVIGKLVNRDPAESPVRIWVPGCATGEEAYSIAILLAEQFEIAHATRQVQIFATDIDSDVLTFARAGIYPAGISEEVSRERLSRFFSRTDDRYKINSDIRSMCTFISHNVLTDPPFSSLDLISCRNLLIYLDVEAQRQLIPLFHQSLRADGCLVLGSSETISNHLELFTEVSAPHCIFRRREPNIKAVFHEVGNVQRASHPIRRPKRIGPNSTVPLSISQTFEQLVLDQFAPACAMINLQGDILHTTGPLAKYLQVSAGAFSNNLFHLVGSDLKHQLRVAIHQAMQTRQKVVRTAIAKDSENESVQITVGAIGDAQENDGLFAIAIQPAGNDTPVTPDPAQASEVGVAQSLEEELRATKVELQNVVQQLESSNEDLAIANEELVSTNEELETANEKLLASQDELESSNEALRANDRVLRIVTDNARVGLSMLDTQHRYVFANNAYKQIFGLGDRDIVGEKIAEVLPHVYTAGTRERLLRAQAGEKIRAEVELGPDLSFIVSIESHEPKGQTPLLIASIVDTTEVRRSRRAAQESSERLRETLDSMMEGCQILDFEYRYTYVNPSAAAHGRKPAEELIGRKMTEVYPGIENTEVFQHIRDAMETRKQAAWENEFVYADGASAVFQLSFQPVPDGVLIFSSDITDRHRATNALHVSEERMRLAIEAARIGTYDVDLVNKKVALSWQLATIGGIAAGAEDVSLELQDILAMIHPDDFPRFRREMVAATDPQGKGHTQLEFRIIRPDGEVRWLSCSGQSYFKKQGEYLNPTRRIGVCIDITENRQRDAQLRHTSELLNAVADNTTDSVFVKDLQGRYLFVNRAACRLMGKRESEIIGKDDSHFFQGDDLKMIRDNDRRAIESERAITAEERVKFSDNNVCVFQATKAPYRDGSGNIAGLIGISRDVSEARRVEEALRESEERLRLTLSGNEIATWEWNAATQQLHFSPEAALVLRVPSNLLDPQDLSTFKALLHPDDREPFLEMMTESATTGRRCEGEYRIIDANGEIRWIAGRGQSYLDADGKLIRIVGTIGDVTRRRQMQEAENEHRATIAHLSRVASVGEMASSLAHELNQPLTAIMSYARVCMEAAKGRATKKSKQQIAEHLDEISGEAMRAAEIVRRVRAFIRKQAPQQEVADVNALVQDSVDLMHFEFKDAGVVPELHLDPKVPSVTIDSVQIQQVLINLLQNALDAMENTDPADRSLSVHTEVAGRFVKVRVCDSGSGIAPEVKGRIFESFFTTKAKGLGLGLAICRSIVESHGGEMTASTDEAGRTIFEFLLAIDHKSVNTDGYN